MLSKKRKTKLEQNIWKFYLYRLIIMFELAAPIFVLFLQENGLSMTQVMILQSIYTAIIMITVVPAGIIADYLGRKKVLVVSNIIYIAGWAIYALSYGFTGFVLAEAMMAIAAATWMASGTSFFYDTLRELGKEGSFKRKYGNAISIERIMLAIGSITGGFVAATYGFRITFWMAVITSTIATMIIFSLTKTETYKHGDKHYMTHLKDAVKFVKNHQRIRLFIIYTAITYGATFAMWMIYQPYFVKLGISLSKIGIIFSAMFIVSAIGAKKAHKIEEYLGEKKILMMILLVMITSYVSMTIFGKIGFIFPIIISFAGGIMDPVMADYLNKHTESHHRATVNSLNTLVIQGMATIMAPIFGVIVDVYSMEQAFMITGIILIINLFILTIVFKRIK